MSIKGLCRIVGCGLLLLLAGTAVCQESVQGDRQQDKAKGSGTVSPRGARSLVDDIFANPRHNLGFSVGAFGVYQDNLYQTSRYQQTARSVMPTARIFANLGRRKSIFHLDYGAGYQLYNNRRGLDGLEQLGSASYSYLASRNASINIQDFFSSSHNGNLFSTILDPSGSPPGFSTEIMLPRQRIIQNNLTATLGFNTHKNNFSIFAGYNLYRYEYNMHQDLDGFSTGASYSRQITKWFFLSSSYYTYVNKVDPIYRGTLINRLQIGGVRFKLGREWEAEIGGGVELAITYGENLWREEATASLTWNSRSHTFSVRYHRGFYSTVGISGVFGSDEGRVEFGSRLTDRLNLQLSAFYQHGSNFYSNGISTAGSIDYYSALGGLQFRLFEGLIASGNVSYRNQHTRYITGLPATLETYVAAAGIQYIFPSGIR
jgi:hypothetical protein